MTEPTVLNKLEVDFIENMLALSPQFGVLTKQFPNLMSLFVTIRTLRSENEDLTRHLGLKDTAIELLEEKVEGLERRCARLERCHVLDSMRKMGVEGV